MSLRRLKDVRNPEHVCKVPILKIQSLPRSWGFYADTTLKCHCYIVKKAWRKSEKKKRLDLIHLRGNLSSTTHILHHQRWKIVFHGSECIETNIQEELPDFGQIEILRFLPFRKELLWKIDDTDKTEIAILKYWWPPQKFRVNFFNNLTFADSVTT